MPEAPAHILVIDDDKAMRDACFQILSGRATGWNWPPAPNRASACWSACRLTPFSWTW